MTLSDIRDAQARIRGVARVTPLTRTDGLIKLVGDEVWCKEEQRQRTGSFKVRGAYNHISRLPAGTHVVAASAGNHAQGVALAASLCGLRSTIFMPRSASLPKVAATEDYGASVVLDSDNVDEAVVRAKEFVRSEGGHFVPPFDDRAVIAGQGTVGIEIFDLLPEVGTVVAPIGGGGLISGVAAALKALHPACRVVGVEADGAASMRAALASGSLRRLPIAATIADGIAVKSPSALTLAHARAFVDDVVTVTDEEIGEALIALLERMKSVVEPSGAAALAAVMARKHRVGRKGGGRRRPTVVVLSGGNVDPLLLSRLIEHGLSVAGRYMRWRIDVPDRPGSLARLTADVAELDLNVLSVDHHRERASLDLEEVEVALTVETRGADHRRRCLQALRDKGWKVRPY